MNCFVLQNPNPLPPTDDPSDAAALPKPTDAVVVQPTSSASSSRSGSTSRPKSPVSDSKSSDQPPPAYPGYRTRTLTDEKINPKPPSDEKLERSDSPNQLEKEDTDGSKPPVKKHICYDASINSAREREGENTFFPFLFPPLASSQCNLLYPSPRRMIVHIYPLSERKEEKKARIVTHLCTTIGKTERT